MRSASSPPTVGSTTISNSVVITSMPTSIARLAMPPSARGTMLPKLRLQPDPSAAGFAHYASATGNLTMPFACYLAWLWLPKIASGLAQLPRWATLIAGMIDLLKLLGGLLVGVFRSHAAREAEMAFLRQQLVVLQRSAPARLRLRTADRVIFVWLYRLYPSLLEAAVVFKPATLVRWHRSGFRLYWRCPDGDCDHLGFAPWFPVDCGAAIPAKVESHLESAIG